MKKNILAAFAAGILGFSVAGCSQSKVQITPELAQEVALDDASLSESEVQNLNASQSEDVYIITFDHADRHFETQVGSDGLIQSRKIDMIEPEAEEPTPAKSEDDTKDDDSAKADEDDKTDASDSEEPADPSAQQPAAEKEDTASEAEISSATAIANALLYAGYAQNQVSNLNCVLNASQTTYSVSFYAGGYDYLIQVSAKNGQILTN